MIYCKRRKVRPALASLLIFFCSAANAYAELASLHYGGVLPETIKYDDVSVTLDRVKAVDEPDKYVPVLRVSYSDGRKLEVKMPDDVAASEPAADVKIVKLDPLSASPELIFTAFTNGAHCCTLTKIVTVGADKALSVVDAGLLDGDEGFQFSDEDADGSAELIAYDILFLFAPFASYADTVAPLRVYQLRGKHIIDVTRDPKFKGTISKELASLESSKYQSVRHSNGYLAGWVATKAELGQFREAWRKMLAAYDRESNSGFECMDAVPFEKCPSNRLRSVPFPEALGKHLLKTNYISASELRDAMTMARAAKRPARAPKREMP